jgi:hypothetical protein
MPDGMLDGMPDRRFRWSTPPTCNSIESLLHPLHTYAAPIHHPNVVYTANRRSLVHERPLKAPPTLVLVATVSKSSFGRPFRHVCMYVRRPTYIS